MDRHSSGGGAKASSRTTPSSWELAMDRDRCICITMGMYSIEFSEGADGDLAGLRAFDQRPILDAIEEQLLHEPTRETRNRKMLPGVVPPFDAVPPVWELRVGEYRVYYDVGEAGKRVSVRAIRRKPPTRGRRTAYEDHHGARPAKADSEVRE